MPIEGPLSLLEGLIPAVFLIIGMLLESYRRSQGRMLTYEVELIPVFRTRQGYDSRIQVKYDDVPIDTLYSCRVVVRNRGSVPLSDQLIPIELKGNVGVLEERFKTVPELEFGEIRVDEESSTVSRRWYRVELLNPGDEILVDLTVAGGLAPSDVTVPARGGGLKCLSEPSYALREQIYRFLGRAVWILLAVGLVIWLKFEAPLILWSGLVPALIGNRFEYYRDRLGSPRRRLSYQIGVPRPVYTMADPYRERISVEYAGRIVEDLHTCRVVLQNTGNRSLKNQSVLVRLKGANILESSVDTEPEFAFESVGPDDDAGNDRWRYLFPELEPEDKVTVDFTFEGRISSEDVGVGARAELLKVEPQREYWKLVSTLATAENVTWLLVGLAASLVVLLLAFVPGPGGMDALRELGDLLYSWFVDVSAEPGLFSGVFIGAIGLAVTAFVVLKVREWWGQVTAPRVPPRVAHTTEKTPGQVMLTSTITLVVGLLVFACSLGIVVEILCPGTWQQVVEALGL